MVYVRWTFRIALLVILGAFLHYTLPQRDIVRIVGTYEERQDFGGTGDLFWKNTRGATANAPATRDVLFIQSIKANGEVMVYRNQDTGLGWPPYLKFDTANLQTEASEAVSSEADPEWVAMRHYGWRNTWLFGGIFPNALSMKPVSGPDAQLIPWFNIVFFTVLFVFLVTIWRMWRNFREDRIDPVLEDLDEAGDAARNRVTGLFGRLFGRK